MVTMRGDLIAKTGPIELERVDIEDAVSARFYLVGGMAFEKFVDAYFHYLNCIGWVDPLTRERAR